jgi:hypothetical protein
VCNVAPDHVWTTCPSPEGLCANRLNIDVWRVLTGYFPSVPALFKVRSDAILPLGYEITWRSNMQIVEELRKIPAFNGHFAYRHENNGDRLWVYSVGVNNTTIDVSSEVDHTQWTDAEAEGFINYIKEHVND